MSFLHSRPVWVWAGALWRGRVSQQMFVFRAFCAGVDWELPGCGPGVITYFSAGMSLMLV